MDTGDRRWTRGAIITGGLLLVFAALLQDSSAGRAGAALAASPREVPQRQNRGASRSNELWVSARVSTADELTPHPSPDPRAARRLAERERQLLGQAAARARTRPSTLLERSALADDFGGSEFLGAARKSVLAVMARFAPPGGAETFTRSVPVNRADPSLGCTTVQETHGPLDFGDDPPPGAADNFVSYTPNLGIEDYRSLFFGIGPDAGYGVVRPDLGGIDLSGLSLNNYLLEMSRGTYTAGGDILPEPVAVPHSVQYYNAANFSLSSRGRCTDFGFTTELYLEFVESVLSEVTAAYDGVLDFSRFDGNGDRVVDLLVIIHAGYARQTGGGENRLATLSLGFGVPRQIAGFDTPNDATDDYFVEGFNLNPEQLDLGGVQEEFEHQLGLPDLYASDFNNSNGWWGAHSNGVWGGPLGATRPMGHNLWQDWILGWRHPLIIDYDDPRLLSGKLRVEVGRARNTPAGTEDGVIIRLPDTQSVVANLAGTGAGWYSDSGDSLDQRVERQFDLSTATAPITLSFASTWDIEQDYDYGLIEFSSNGGVDWFTLPDAAQLSTDEDPNGLGVTKSGTAWGLTGQASGTLEFDLSLYAGQSLWVRFRYLTDGFTANPGWHVDDVLLTDQGGVLYENDLESGFSDWTSTAWLSTPQVTSFPRYYTLEWRDDSGYDASFRDAYRNTYRAPHEPPPERIVDRLPYTTPGLVIAYRDTRQTFDFSMGEDLFTGDSIGPKYGHLVIDSHPRPLRFDTPDPSQGNLVGLNLPQANLVGDAAFGLTPTQPWMARLDFDPLTGRSSEVKSWPSQAPVHAFHDSYGYYPGVFAAPDGTFRFNSTDASAVLPGKQAYSTRVTDVAGEQLPALYGTRYNGSVLGTGNPGDDQAQFGVHVEVESSAATHATIAIWNRLFEVKFQSRVTRAPDGSNTFSGEVVENIGGRLLAPVIVLELPPAVRYLEGSAFGGLEPAEPSFASPQAIADQLRRGASVAKTSRGPVRFLVWSGAELATRAAVPELGFSFEMLGAATDQVGVQLFKNSNEPMQNERLPVCTPSRTDDGCRLP